MRILAVIPFTGDHKLVAMTRRCVREFHELGMHVVVVNNAADERIDLPLEQVTELVMAENVGFGVAVNAAIEIALQVYPELRHVLVANNDLEFPNEKWFEHLIAEVDGKHVLSPTTNITACPESREPGPKDVDPVLAPQVSAFCWLVPVEVIQKLRRSFGFNLFDPAFFAYGEDDLTSAIFRKIIGPKPFKVVKRSWVKHLKGQTAKQVGVRPGDPKNLKLLAQRKKALKVK